MNPELKELQLHVAQISASASVLEFERFSYFRVSAGGLVHIGMKNVLQFAPVFSVETTERV